MPPMPFSYRKKRWQSLAGHLLVWTRGCLSRCFRVGCSAIQHRFGDRRWFGMGLTTDSVPSPSIRQLERAGNSAMRLAIVAVLPHVQPWLQVQCLCLRTPEAGCAP